MNTSTTTRALAAAAIASLALLAGCGTSSPTDATNAAYQPTLKKDAALHDQLPAKVKQKGELVIVTPGTNEPWWHRSGGTYTGVAANLVHEMSAVLGVKVRFVAVPDLAAAFATVSSGRYDAGFNPYGDTASENVDVVDVVKEIVPFLVQKGNPKNIGTMESLCGLAISATGPAGKGSAYYILQQQSKTCTAAGKQPIKIVAVTGVPNGVLAVQSKRADAFFSSGAPLFYYSQHSDGALEVVGEDTDTGFSDLYQGMIVPKGSPLAKPVLGAFQKVFDSGVYAKQMKKAGLDREMLDKPGLNLFTGTR